MGITAAIIGSAVVGGTISSMGASDAASTQAQGATQSAQIAANAQLQGLQFVQQQEAPYNQAGQQALQRYEQLLGLGGGNFGGISGGGGPAYRPTPGGGVQQILSNGPSIGGQRALNSPAGATGGSFDLSSFLSNTPGYQFELGQGMNAIENSAAARGGALSGNTLQGEMQFGQGLASQQFQQYMQQLAGLTGVGQAAASGVATAGGNLIPGAGASMAGGVNAAALANSAGIVGQTNALTGAFNAPQVQGALTSGLQSLFGLFNNSGGGDVPPGGY